MKRIQFTCFLLIVIFLCGCSQTEEHAWQKEYALGLEHLAAGNYQSAIESFTTAIEMDSEQPLLYINRGSASILFDMSEANLLAASEDYRQAIRLNKSYAESSSKQSDIYFSQKNCYATIEFLQNALTLMPDNHDDIEIQMIELQLQLEALYSAAENKIYFINAPSLKDIKEEKTPFFEDAVFIEDYTPAKELQSYQHHKAYLETHIDELYQQDRLDDELYLPDPYDTHSRVYTIGSTYITKPFSDHSFKLEFRHIRSGMSRRKVYAALGLSQDGIAFAESTRACEFWISNGTCSYAIDLDEYISEETSAITNEDMIVLAYENYGYVSFLFQDNYLYSVQLQKKTISEEYNPDSKNPEESQSSTPEEFSEQRFKQTVRPYLQALSNLHIPQKYCTMDWSDELFIEDTGLYYYHVTNFSSVQQAIDCLKPYVTDEYLQTHFPASEFLIYDDKLYLAEASMGYTAWDANSTTLLEITGNNVISVEVDEYGRGDNYCGTKTIYFYKEKDQYVVSDVSQDSRDKGYPDLDYTPPGYDPV